MTSETFRNTSKKFDKTITFAIHSFMSSYPKNSIMTFLTKYYRGFYSNSFIQIHITSSNLKILLRLNENNKIDLESIGNSSRRKVRV